MSEVKLTYSESIFQKRWKKFKTLKRAYISLHILIWSYLLSFVAPLFINNKPLIIKYEDAIYFPAFADLGYPYTKLFARGYTGKMFGIDDYGEPNFRKLSHHFSQEGNPNWSIMPLYKYHPNENLLSELNSEPPTAPDSKHWFGTDNRGRDILARVIYGYNISMSFAIFVTIFGYIIGIIIGAIQGYFGGRFDLYFQRFIEIFSSLPFLYTIMIVSVIMTPNFYILAIINIILAGWIGISYFIRSEFYREKAKDYVAAAVAMGASRRRIMFKHILPNSITPIITFAPFAIVGGISALVSLDYLGFGLPAPTPSWGELAKQGVEELRYWWLIVTSINAMFLTLLMISFIGEGVREAFDPKIYSRLR